MMARHEDTVVSRLPNRFLRAATQVSQVRKLHPVEDFEAETQCDGRNGSDTAARRAIAALDELQPPMPANWGTAAHAHGTPPPPPPGFAPQPPPAYAPAPAPSYAPSPVAATETQGKVICVFGCRGGAGATTLSVNMAAQLARAGKSVVLMDLDLQLGDVFVALDLAPQTSIAALAREASTIDAAALKRRLAHHDAGFYAITQTGRIDDIDETLPERMPALLSTLTDHFDYVIVDGIRDFGDYALSVLDMANAVALVLTQDVAAVRRTARVVTLFRQLGYGDNKLKLVLNRRVRKASVNESEIERALNMPIAASVRNDYKRVGSAFNDGSLIGDVARTSGVSRDIGALTQVLAQPRASTSRALLQTGLAQPEQKKSLFSFLRGSKGAR
jgi:Flp pilus assembly CpaE family ATPase